MKKIDQNFVEVANARLGELTRQVELLSIIDNFEDLGNSFADKLRKEHSKFLSDKFGVKVSSVEEAVSELNKVREILQPFVQVDHLSEKFSKLSSKPEQVTTAFETIKQDHLERIMKVLEIDEREV